MVIDTLGQGGAEHSLGALLPAMAVRGVRARVRCAYESRGPLPDRLRRAGIDVRYGHHRSIRRLVADVRAELRGDPVDVVHASLFGPVLASGLAALGTGVPVLASVVNTAAVRSPLDPRVASWKLQAVHRVEAWSLRRLATAVHAVTPGVAASVIEDSGVPPDRVRIVERGRDPERFRPARPGERDRIRQGLGLDPHEPVAIAVGRHEHQKGYEVVLAAMAELQREGFVGRLLVAGRTGAATPAVEAAIATLPRPGAVRLMGDRDDVADLYRAADVFVQGSWREGAAGAVVEAMASALPVVVTDVAGFRGVLEDGVTARLVPVGDARALAAGVAEAFADPTSAAARSRAARAVFLERFTIDRAADGLAALYGEVAAGRV